MDGRKRPLHEAVNLRRNQELRHLLATRDSSAAQEADERGWTPLHKAAEVNNLEAAYILLKHGAGADKRDMERRSPLHVAMEYKASVKLVTLLLQCKAEINGQDESGHTPLHVLAKHSKDLDLAEHLLANGANPNIMNNERQTPIQLAVEPGCDEPFQLTLLKYGARLNSANGKFFMKKYKDMPALRELDRDSQQLMIAFMMATASAKQTQRLQSIANSTYAKVKELSTLTSKKQLANLSEQRTVSGRNSGTDTGASIPGARFDDVRMSKLEDRLDSTLKTVNQVLDRVEEYHRVQEKHKFELNQERFQIRKRVEQILDSINKLTGQGGSVVSTDGSTDRGLNTGTSLGGAGGNLDYLVECVNKVMSKQDELDAKIGSGGGLNSAEQDRLLNKIERLDDAFAEFQKRQYYTEDVVKKNHTEVYKEMKKVGAMVQMMGEKQGDMERNFMRQNTLNRQRTIEPTPSGLISTSATPQFPGTPQSGADFGDFKNDSALQISKDLAEIKQQLVLIEERQDYFSTTLNNNEDESALNGMVQEMFQYIQTRLDDVQSGIGQGAGAGATTAAAASGAVAARGFGVGEGGGETLTQINAKLDSLVNDTTTDVKDLKGSKAIKGIAEKLDQVATIQSKQTKLLELSVTSGKGSEQTKSGGDVQQKVADMQSSLAQVQTQVNNIVSSVSSSASPNSLLNVVQQLESQQSAMIDALALRTPSDGIATSSRAAPPVAAVPDSARRAELAAMSAQLNKEQQDIDEQDASHHLIYQTKCLEYVQQQLEHQSTTLASVAARLAAHRTTNTSYSSCPQPEGSRDLDMSAQHASMLMSDPADMLDRLDTVSSGAGPISQQSNSLAMIDSITFPVLGPTEHQWAEVLLMTRQFRDKAVPGQGDTCVAYQGLLDNGTKVAIKCLPLEYGKIPADEFSSKVSNLCHLAHPHVVALHGWAINPKNTKDRVLVTEFMEGGTLVDLLANLTQRPVEWQQRLRILRDVARGLAGIHATGRVSSSNVGKQCGHYNLMPSSVLLTDRQTAKVGDMGMVEMLGDAWDIPHHAYQDPDVRQTRRFDQLCDSYSWGAVAMLLIAGKTTSRGLHTDVQRALSMNRERDLAKVIDPRAGNWGSIGKEVLTLAQKCINVAKRNERPSISGDVLPFLEKILRSSDAGE